MLEGREWMKRTANRTKLLHNGEVKQYFHTGVFGELPTESSGGVDHGDEEEKEDNRAWSCCMNADPNSIGCAKRTVSNATRWNYA